MTRTPAEPVVDLWRVGLDEPPAVRDRLWPLLGDDERERAARFHFARDRHRFVVAHGALRTILALHLGRPPREVTFVHGPHGKPEIPDSGMSFNLTHSEALAVCAVVRGRRVGVDVEAVRPDVATDEVARTYFSELENEALHSLPAPLRAAAFFACWTRKEAYVKARGDGLSLRLDRFDVLSPDAAGVSLSTRPDAGEARRWRLVDLDPGPGYAGALAVEGAGVRLAWRRWRA